MDKQTEIKNIQTIVVKGRFDAHMVAKVQEIIELHLEQGQTRLVVSLNGVHFIDTRALALLVTSMKRCRQQNGDLRLCALQQSVQIIFELTKLDKAFQMFETEAEAIASFK